VPASIKIAAAIVAMLATLAGIGFGVQQIIPCNRTFEAERIKEERLSQEKQATDERNFQLELEKQEIAAATQEAGLLAQQKQSDAQKEDADAQLAESRQKAADAEARKAEADINKARREAVAQDVQDENAAKIEQRKQLAQQLQALTALITKLRAAPSPSDAVSAIAGISEFLRSEGQTKTDALDA